MTFQDNAQGGKSPAQASTCKCCFNMIPGGWSEPQTEQGETHSKGNDQSLGQHVSSSGMQVYSHPTKGPSAQRKGLLHLPSPAPAYSSILGAEQLRQET